MRSVLIHLNWKLESPSFPHECACLEDKVHLFFHCTIARAIWLASPWHIKWEDDQHSSLETYLGWLTKPFGKIPIHESDGLNFFLFAVLALDTIWKV